MNEFNLVFISHSNAQPDYDITVRLVEFLRKKNINVWYDGMLTAGYWYDAVLANLQASSVYVLVESERSLKSPQVHKEIDDMTPEFTDRGKVLIPLILDRYSFEHCDELKGNVKHYIGGHLFQSIIMSKFPNEESAFEKMSEYILHELRKRKVNMDGNNRNDFLLEDDMKRLVKYNGNDPAVVIPDCVKIIDKDAFSMNKTIKSVQIPESVEEIGSRAFCGCTNLISVTGMQGVRSCGYKAFDDIGITFNGDNIFTLNGVVIGGKVRDKKLAIPEGTRVIADRAFACINSETIEFPQSLQYIGVKSFADCCKVKEVEFPVGLKALGNNAFAGCINLEQVTVTDKEPDGFDNAFNIKNFRRKQNG